MLCLVFLLCCRKKKVEIKYIEKEIDRLQRIITNGIDEMSVNMISDSLIESTYVLFNLE